MKVVSMRESSNSDAVDVLEEMIERVKSGEVTAVAISCTTNNNSISGIVSSGANVIMIWAAMEHNARQFYENVVLGDES